MDLSKARCMQSAQRVLFVVRRGTTILHGYSASRGLSRGGMWTPSRTSTPLQERKIRAFRSCNGVLARDGVHIPPLL